MPWMLLLPSMEQTQLLLNSSRSIFLASFKHICLWKFLETELMHIHMGSKRDQTDQCILWNHGHGLCNGSRTRFQLILCNTCIDNKQVRRRRHSPRPWQAVLNRATLREKFSWNRCLGNSLIMRRKVIASHTERACPHFTRKIHHSIWIQDPTTRLARHRVVLNNLQIGSLLGWSHHNTKGHHALGSLKPTPWPHIPHHTNPINLL
mmetsp:Transcript_8868/g.17632  ORF Transcript_8868/g.17632 Transcript_8868/m.17632 type:complete len:206 (-) Transcript_8868:330-947(-)